MGVLLGGKFFNGREIITKLKKGPLGTCAVIGISTKFVVVVLNTVFKSIYRHAALHCPGYLALIGSDDQSWGWNLVDNTVVHNGEILGKYPRLLNNTPKYQVINVVKPINSFPIARLANEFV